MLVPNRRLPFFQRAPVACPFYATNQTRAHRDRAQPHTRSTMEAKKPQAVVMRGTPSVGWTIYGPFVDWETAAAWADAHQGEDPDWIVSLESPEVTA